jgi:hypothetical protein
MGKNEGVKRRAALVLVVATFITACGGGDGGANDADEGATTADCAGVPAAELAASGGLCSDTGLRPVDGGFSFENWGGPVKEDAVTVTTAIAIFGEEAVCARTTAAGCVPYPAVQQWIDGSNLQIQGGRCEGMAVLSQRIHDGGDSAQQLQEAAVRTADLKKETLPVAASISRWWVSQGFEPVLQATSRAWELEPTEIVAEIVDAIANDAGVTIGIYDHGAGHAVTPIAVTRADDGTFAISVYDNNYPGEVTVMTVDPATETWSYDVGATNSGAVASAWSGGKGDIDYVVMADREGKQLVPWSDDDRGQASKGSARITVTTGGKSVAGLLIDVGGSTIDTRDLSTVTNGVKVFPNRGGIGTGAMVEIPDGLADVKIKPVVGEILDSTTESVELAVSIDAPGPGSQFLSDTIDAEDFMDESYDDFSLILSTDEEFENIIDLAEDGEIEVDVAYEEEAADITLEDGQDLNVVDGEGDEDFDIEITDADGSILYEFGFDGESDSDDIGVANVDIDEATGEASVETEMIEPAAVDDEVLAVTEADEPARDDTLTETNPATDDDGTNDSIAPTDTLSDPVTPDGGAFDDRQSPPETDAQESPDTTPVTAPPDDATTETEPAASDDTTASGED